MKYIHNRKLSSALIVTAVSAFAWAVPTSAEELTISMWGGYYGENWKKDVVDPWVEETGIDVIMDFGPSSQRLSKTLATRGRNADIFFITDHQMAVLQERGLLDSVDAANVPNLENLYEFARDPLGQGNCPAISLLGIGMMYNKEHFETPPTSWLDVTRDDLEGRPAFMDIGYSVAPSVLLHYSTLLGGGADNMDPGFEMMSDLKDRARLYSQSEAIDWVNSGEVSLAPMLNIFAKEDPQLDMRFTYPDDGVLGVVNMACLLKGSANKSTAEKFLNYYLSPEVQEIEANRWGETPVVTNATIPEDTPFKFISVDQIDELVMGDPIVIYENLADWVERFQDEVIAD